MPQLEGTRPRPRVLVRWAGPQGTAVTEAITPFAGTVATVSSLGDLRFDEWDCVLTDRPWHYDRVEAFVGHGHHTLGRHLPEHVSVFYCFDASGTLDDTLVMEGGIVTPSIQHGHICNEHVIPDGLDAPLRHLVRRSLLPAVTERSSHLTISLHDRLPGRTPFMWTAAEGVLAASYRRGLSNDDGEVWLVPGDVDDVVPWVLEAFRHWHLLLPSRFPIDPSWRSNPQWWSAEEQEISADEVALREEFTNTLQAFQNRLSDIERRRKDASAAADAGPRALLTAQGDDLVAAVAQALRMLGFTVDDERDDTAERGQLLEDLIVTDDTAEEWEAVVEVRSYTGGAKVRPPANRPVR